MRWGKIVSAKIVFMRRSLKEIELFGGDVYIDIDGKNIGILKTTDYVIELENGNTQLKCINRINMILTLDLPKLKSISRKVMTCWSIPCPMIVTQPGNIIVSDYKSEEQIANAILEREQKSLTTKE